MPVKLFFLDWWFAKQDLGMTYCSKLFVVYGPALAGIIVTAVTSGKAGLSIFFARLKPNFRQAVWWVVLPVAGTLITALACIIAGISPYSLFTIVINNLPLWGLHLVLATLIIGFGEEMGWRGYLWPELLKTRKVRLAIPIMFVVWGLWHFPLLFNGYKFVIPFLILELSATVILAWIWQRVNGNIFVLAIAHGSIDFSEFFFEKQVLGSGQHWDYILTMWGVLSLLYAAVAIVIVLVPATKKDLFGDKGSK